MDPCFLRKAVFEDGFRNKIIKITKKKRFK